VPVNPLAGETIADLKAVQKMIDHANHTVERDFEEVKADSVLVKQVRAQLDKEMGEIRTRLEPACKEYAAARRELLTGEGGKPPTAAECLRAQGRMQVMLGLDQKVAGCAESCRAPGSEEKPASICDHGPCHSALKCTNELENVIGGLDWKNRDDRVRFICSTAGFRMYIDPPAAFGGGSGDCTEPTANAAAAPPLELAVLLAPPPGHAASPRAASRAGECVPMRGGRHHRGGGNVASRRPSGRRRMIVRLAREDVPSYRRKTGWFSRGCVELAPEPADAATAPTVITGLPRHRHGGLGRGIARLAMALWAMATTTATTILATTATATATTTATRPSSSTPSAALPTASDAADVTNRQRPRPH